MSENLIYADLNLTQSTRPRQQITDIQDSTYAEVKVQPLDTNAEASYTSTGKRCSSRTRVAGVVAVILLLLVVAVCLILTYHPTASSSPDIKTLPTTYEETVACPKNWERNGEKCYFFGRNESKDWDVYRQECTEKGAELVVIDNNKELDYLSSRSKCCYYLLGLRYSEDEKKWKWINGVEHSTDMFEIKKEPDHFCAVIRSGKVESASCKGDSSTQNMCEKAAGISERQS